MLAYVNKVLGPHAYNDVMAKDSHERIQPLVRLYVAHILYVIPPTS